MMRAYRLDAIKQKGNFMQKCSVIIVDTKPNIQKTLQSLEANKEYIAQILATENINGATTITPLSNTLAAKLNALIDAASQEYILILSGDTELEEESLEEFFEVLKENPDANIIYPNEVLIQGDEEHIKNYEDWYQKEKQLLASLSIENYLPDRALLIQKNIIQKLGGFQERYGDFTIYAFLYKNLSHLTLKLSELSFINRYIYESFVDTSYRSLLLRDLLKEYELKEIFSSLNWDQKNIARATAYTLIGDRLAKYYDFYNASRFYRNALLTFHNQETLKKLLDAYIQIGLFKETIHLLKTQDATPEIFQIYEDKIHNLQDLVAKLEKLIEEGKAANILIASNDIISTYDGAPIYNIFGIIYFMQQDLQNAYKFFYKAATMNPLDQDILHNLAEVAKKIGKEEEVIGLYERLTKEG